MKIETLPACLNQHLATLSNLEKRTAVSSHTKRRGVAVPLVIPKVTKLYDNWIQNSFD